MIPMIKTKNTQLSPIEKKVLTIITQEPNITYHLIKNTIEQQGTTVTKTQLENTLEKLSKKNLIQTQTQKLASIKFTSYTIKKG
jgi:predicted transcriptional regulator